MCIFRYNLMIFEYWYSCNPTLPSVHNLFLYFLRKYYDILIYSIIVSQILRVAENHGLVIRENLIKHLCLPDTCMMEKDRCGTTNNFIIADSFLCQVLH